MYYSIIKSQFKDLSIDVFIFNMSKPKLYRHTTNIKIKFFASHFFNLNISVTIKLEIFSIHSHYY